MQHKTFRVSTVNETPYAIDVDVQLVEFDGVDPTGASCVILVMLRPSSGPLEHRESSEADRLEGRDERPEGWRCGTCAAVNRDKLTRCYECGDERPGGGAPEPVSAAEDVTRPEDVPVPRTHELLAIDGIPADTYPFLPTGRTVDVHVRHCRHCGASVDRLRIHTPPAKAESMFVEWLCSRCAM